VDWDKLSSYISKGQVYRGMMPRVTLAKGKVLNTRLANPTGSGKTINLVELAASASDEIWGEMRTNGTLTGTPTSMTPINMLTVGITAIAQGSLSYSVNGTLPYGGNIYNTYLVGPHRSIDYSDDNYRSSLTEPMILAAGNSVVVGYGPAVGTLDIAVGFTWWES
jgi:hypothetical protein